MEAELAADIVNEVARLRTYERAWKTLKAESGYRFSEAMHEKGITLLSLMERMEDRVREESAQSKSSPVQRTTAPGQNDKGAEGI